MLQIYKQIFLGWCYICICEAVKDVVPTNLDDPDDWLPLEPPEPPGDEQYWSTHSKQAEAVGLLYAGGSEFPWIVDIRRPDTDQELWAVGNLITFNHVISTCRGMARLVEVNPWNAPPENIHISTTDLDIEVNVCRNYLWRFDTSGKRKDGPKDGEDELQTSRKASSVSFNPEWTLNSLENDIAIIELNKGIHPIMPYISYMPIPENPVTGLINTPDFPKQVENRWVCHIASFGKNSKNLNSNEANDHKVKYRVYYMDWPKCVTYFKWLCPRKYLFCKSLTSMINDKHFCFRSHAKVGAICDHDVGAPLVCDGFVYGIVVRGVDFNYCHNLTPIPAIVRRINFMDCYIKKIMVHFKSQADSKGNIHWPRSRLFSPLYLTLKILSYIFISFR